MLYRPSTRPALTALLLIAAAAAQAQAPVYRCGPDGREYSATPCPGGKTVAVDDARSTEQQRQASERESAAMEQEIATERAVIAAVRSAWSQWQAANEVIGCWC